MSKIKPYNIILAISLSIAEIFLIPRIIYGFSYASGAEEIARISTVFIVTFGIYAIFKLLSKVKIAWIVTITAASLSIITLLSLLIVSFGILQDTQNVQCAGFFGATTDCINIYKLQIFIIVLHPFVLLVFGLFSLAAIVSQIRYGKMEKSVK